VTARLPELRYLPDIVPNAERCFAQLAADVPWRDQMRARHTASFGRPYNYSGQAYDAVPMPPAIQALERLAAGAVGHGFHNCLLKFYTTGNHTMGFPALAARLEARRRRRGADRRADGPERARVIHVAARALPAYPATCDATISGTRAPGS